MSRSIRDLRDIINVSRLLIYDEDADVGEISNTECSLEGYLTSRSNTSLGESSFMTPSVLTRPGTSLGRPNTSLGRPNISSAISNRKDKRPCSVPIEKLELHNDVSPSLSIYSGSVSVPLVVRDLKKVNFPNRYTPVPPIGKKNSTKKNFHKSKAKESMVFDHLFSYLDSTVVNIWLESCNRTTQKLNDFVLRGDIFVNFAWFFLSKLSYEQYCELLDLEFSILIDHLKYAFHTGYHANIINEKDIKQLTSAIIVEFPGILKDKEKGAKSLLDILIIISSQKSETYRKLLKTVDCYTVNKQYIKWLLSIRAFGLISFINGVIKFYENINELTDSKTMSDSGPSYNFEERDVKCLLHKWTLIAATKGYIEVIAYLYTNQKVDLSLVRDEKKRNLLLIAVTKRHVELIYYLSQLDVVIDINEPADNGNNALLYAISKNDLEMVKTLAELGADLNYWNQQSDGATALHMAVLLGSPTLVKFLLDSGADKSAVMGVPATTTPLMLADELGNVEIMKALET